MSQSSENPLRTNVRCDTIPEESTGRVSTGNEILIITVDMGPGRSGQIVVRENDEYTSLAQDFVAKHHLPSDLVAVLRSEIEANVAALEGNRSTERTKRKSTDRYSDKRTEQTQKGVFQRLQMRPQTHKPTKSVPEYSAQPKNPPWSSDKYSNPGEKMYAKGLQMKGAVSKYCHEKLKERGVESEREMTFAPKVGERSKEVGSKRKVEDLLIARGRRSRESVERQREEQLAQETAECTFTPQINATSHLLSIQRSSSLTRFEELHADARRRQTRQDLVAHSYMQANYPFRPMLVARQASTSDLQAFERLADPKLQEEKSERRRREQEEQWRDPDQFRPRVGRSPKKPRNPLKVPVGEYLYSMRTATHNQSPRKGTKVDVTVESKDVSERLLQRKRRSRYLDIFTSLNPDENQEITASRIAADSLSAELFPLLTPLLDELATLKVTLNFTEFADAMDALLKTLTPGEKAQVLGYAKKDANSPSPNPFRPQLTPYSGSASFRQRLQTPLYQRTMKEKENAEARLRAERERKGREQLQECSFQPRTIPYAVDSD